MSISFATAFWQNHPQINIVDFDFYGMDIFNRCENTNDDCSLSPAGRVSTRY